MFSGMINGIVGTSYTSEDADLVAVENSYAALETELQREIDNIGRDHPGYDEYRYDLDRIGHNPLCIYRENGLETAICGLSWSAFW